MTIDWNAFTPCAALAGGLLIGLAASMLVLLNGRIAGISGIVGGLLAARSRRRGVAGSRSSSGSSLRRCSTASVAALPSLRIDAGWGALVAAGLLVGIGTRYGSGCTSGHGVCGLSRASPRSMAATAVFIAAGVATVFVARHLLAL